MTENTTGAADATYKLGNEFLPFHPSASHIEPAYRDGWNACYKAALAASAPVAPTQEAESVRWEFRWLNPANNPYSSPSEMAWKLVEPKGMQPLEAALSDLRAYRYAGKPCYEVRPLFAQAAPVAPAPITDAEQAAWFAGLDEGRSQVRGAAQAAPSMDAKQLGDAVVKWLGCETTKPRGDTGEPERRIDVSVERLGFAVAAVLKTVTAPAPASGEAVSPFGYFRAEPFGWADCAESDEGARPLYEAPPAQEVQREEVCKCCGEGMARLVVTRECDTCTSVYAGMSEYAIAKNARAPLSAPQIAAMYLESMGSSQHMFSMVEGAVTRFVRALEKHHGITPQEENICAHTPSL